MKTNHKTMKKLTQALGIAGALLCGQSFAQSVQTPSMMGADNGWYIAPSINAIDPDNGFVGGTGSGLGLRLGTTLSPAWDLQLGPSYAKRNSNGINYKQTTLGADLLYFFSRDKFKPFVSFGVGGENNKTSGSAPANNREGNSFYLGAGIGFQYALADQWGMQADFKHLKALDSTNDFNFSNPKTNLASLGLTYNFDKPAKTATKVIAPIAPPAAASTPAPVAAAAIAAPTPPPAPVAPVPPPAPRFERVTLAANEMFAFDRAELKLPQPRLDEIAAAMTANSSITNVLISGYTDRLGTDKYNQPLSQRRADAVKNYLTGKGVSANRLNAVGKGEANPVVECKQKKRADLIVCLAPNRRMEVEQISYQRQVK